MDAESGKLWPRSCSSASGDGANSGEGGEIPPAVLCRDTTWVGLLRVSVSAPPSSSSLGLLFGLEAPQSALTGFISNLG